MGERKDARQIPDSAARTESGCPFNSSGERLIEGRRELRSFDEIPGARPLPLLGWRGNLLRFFRDPIRYLETLRREFGEVAALTSGRNQPLIFRRSGDEPRTVFVLGPSANREVLTSLELFDGGPLKAPKGCEWLSESMISAVGARRVQRRALLKPAFTRSHLRHYHSEVVDETRSLLARWRGVPQIALDREMYDHSTRIASRCFYGQPPDFSRNNLAFMLRQFASLLFSPVASVPLDLPGSPYRRLIRTARRVRELLLAELERKAAVDDAGTDVVAMMQAAQKDAEIRLTDDELLGEAVALYLAGHDVPANAATFTLILLSQHPEDMAEVVDELDRELGGEPPTYEQCWKLPVLDRAIKESLRLLGPALLILRRAQCDTELAGYRIPTGTEVLLSPYTTHTDGEIYPQPKRYRPDRWLEEKPSAFEYLPFSYGGRRCLGASFAEMQLKVLLAMLLQRFRLTPVRKARFDVKCTFVIHPAGPVPFSLAPQDREFERSRVPLRGRLHDLVQLRG